MDRLFDIQFAFGLVRRDESLMRGQAAQIDPIDHRTPLDVVQHIRGIFFHLSFQDVHAVETHRGCLFDAALDRRAIIGTKLPEGISGDRNPIRRPQRCRSRRFGRYGRGGQSPRRDRRRHRTQNELASIHHGLALPYFFGLRGGTIAGISGMAPGLAPNSERTSPVPRLYSITGTRTPFMKHGSLSVPCTCMIEVVES